MKYGCFKGHKLIPHNGSGFLEESSRNVQQGKDQKSQIVVEKYKNESVKIVWTRLANGKR